MKKILIIILFINLIALNGFSGGVKNEIKKISGLKGIENAQWSLSVKYADNGKDVVSLNENQNLIPASILKIFTTAAALEYMGSGYRFKTKLYYRGQIKKGTLFGNMYIVGGGDPSLGSHRVMNALSFNKVFAKWAAGLKRAGIKRIKGNIYADDSLFNGIPTSSTWAWEDIGNYYAAWPSALSINDNIYKLYFKPAKKEGEIAKVLKTAPHIPGLKFTNFMETGPKGSGDHGYIFNMPKNYRAVLRGTVPLGPEEFSIKGAIPDPALFCAQHLKKYLKGKGIEVKWNALKLSKRKKYLEKKLLAEIKSPPLKNIIFPTNKKSFNLYAELLLRHIAVINGRNGNLAAGLYTLKDFLSSNSIDVSEMKLKDASGLSRLNTVKAKNFTNFLVGLYNKKYFNDFYDSLVSPGEKGATGHIKRFGLGTFLEKNIRIKSGSLNGVRAYSGYFRTKKNRLVAFTSIINNYSIKASEIDGLHQNLFLKIAEEY
ncbi:MAG: D-alanyl-D-alanine carboxypeptidase/D-alanyl-D-alanine-endopeptidase [Elusimicrobiota bacterium]|nr:D-alanyl-D-alanine carboxypeptidase/D-alanyl-D-alanine-endopeptidase [Elusimicrobiota bacterium]